jgi:hypothetical protein
VNEKYEWKQVYKSESYGGNTALKDIPGVAGIQISILTNSTPEEMQSLYLHRSADQAEKEITEYFLKSSEELVQKKLQLKREFEEAFEKSGLPAVYMEEIPNEYWPEPYVIGRALSPWFVCTTRVGHFKVGWRKRVIVLDWERTDVKANGETIFPEEYADSCSTVGEHYIHTNWDNLPKHIALVAKQIFVDKTE